MRATVLAAALTLPSVSAAAIELGLPIACEPGIDCVVQSYFDHDPDPGARDYRCGRQTYDGHTGTDFRLPTLQDMADGVAVLAAAGGTVTGTRNDMPDVLYSEDLAEMIDGRECGNGLLIDHGDGWETQYCHLKRGSVAVAAGSVVAAGDFLGEVGLSGLTAFPHVEFSVMKDRVDLDPFAPEPQTAGDACTASSDAGTGLWRAEVAAVLDYQPAFVLNVGFANGEVLESEVDSGVLRNLSLTPDSAAIVFFGRAISLQTGDIQRLVITGPDGAVLDESDFEPLDRPKAEYFAFTGKRRSEPWPAGVYRGRYSVIRGGEEIAYGEVETTLQ